MHTNIFTVFDAEEQWGTETPCACSQDSSTVVTTRSVTTWANGSW